MLMSKSSNIFFWCTVIAASCLAALVVNPSSFSVTHVGWLLEGDLAQTLVGWEFYRSSPVSEPITRIANLFPLSSFSVIQTDTIPWVSVIVKYLASVLGLKGPFHFIGLWLVFCWILQGVYAALFSRLLKLQGASLTLLVFLFIFSPVLLFRFGHFSLMAHWIILAVIYEAFRLIRGQPSSFFRTFGISSLVVFSLGVHPYLFAIAAPILGFSIIFERCSFYRKIFVFGFIGIATFLSVKILGFSAVKEIKAADFGACNTDLLSLFNSFGSSLFIPKLRAFWCQPEGYFYFGLGMLTVFVLFRKSLKELFQNWWSQKPGKYFLVLGLGYVVYSLASPIRFGGNPIVELPFYRWVEPLPSIFRSTGRWIWPIYYLVLIAAVYVLDRAKFRFKKILLPALIVLQFIEFIPLYRSFRTSTQFEAESQIDRFIQLLPKPTATNKKIHLFPGVVSVGCGIDDKSWTAEEWALVMLAVARTGWQIDSGLGARFDQGLIEKCREQNRMGPKLEFPLITKVIPTGKYVVNNLLPGIYLVESERSK